MKRNILNLMFACLMLAVVSPAFAQAPKKIPADKQRALQWKPEKGQYYFSHSLVFDYQNKADRTAGKLKIYLDPVSGALCFTKENAFGDRGKAFDFVIAFPDGKYIFCGTDDAGKKMRIVEMVKEVKPDAEAKAEQKENFTTYCIPTGNKRVDFGLESLEYDLTYATSDTKDKIWLSKPPFSSYPLYGLEFVESAVSLPVSFDYLHLFPSDLLITEVDSKDLIMKLTSLQKDPIQVATKGYPEVKLDD